MQPSIVISDRAEFSQMKIFVNFEYVFWIDQLALTLHFSIIFVLKISKIYIFEVFNTYIFIFWRVRTGRGSELMKTTNRWCLWWWSDDIICDAWLFRCTFIRCVLISLSSLVEDKFLIKLIFVLCLTNFILYNFVYIVFFIDFVIMVWDRFIYLNFNMIIWFVLFLEVNILNIHSLIATK